MVWILFMILLFQLQACKKSSLPPPPSLHPPNHQISSSSIFPFISTFHIAYIALAARKNNPQKNRNGKDKKEKKMTSTCQTIANPSKISSCKNKQTLLPQAKAE
ncbi:hypothetical protein DFH27DRAFT_345428 [Peziza echinospora]|nr:hypothetical protein DFH27DRAFT_345428 [Peziza echinospora]